MSLLLEEELSPRNLRPITHPSSLLQIIQATYSSLQTARGYIWDARGSRGGRGRRGGPCSRENLNDENYEEVSREGEGS